MDYDVFLNMFNELKEDNVEYQKVLDFFENCQPKVQGSKPEPAMDPLDYKLLLPKEEN